MVYVDPLMNHGWVLCGHATANCHLFADNLEDLHKFAASLGMKMEWFQDERLPHYDLTPARRQKAVELGAKEVTRRQLVEFMRAWSK